MCSGPGCRLAASDDAFPTAPGKSKYRCQNSVGHSIIVIRDDRFMITKKVLKVQENRMAKTSPDACLRCDAGEQTLAHPRGLGDYTEHDFATLASTRLFWRLVGLMILIDFLGKFQ